MNQASHHPAGGSAVLLESTINTLIARIAPQRLLVVSSSPASLSFIEGRHSRLLAWIDTAGVMGASSVNCRVDALPFEDRSFNMLILHHVLTDGAQLELDEAERVLKGNGQLLVIGRGRFGKRSGQRADEQPAIDTHSVCRQMESRAFRIRQCEGLGMRSRNVHLRKSWQRPALRFSDLVLIRGRHTRHKPVVTPLKFSQPQVAGVQSASLEGVFREAV